MASEIPVPPEIDKSEKFIRYCVEKGKVTVEAFNFGGVGCRAATERAEQRLGIVTSRKDKDDDDQSSQQTVSCR